MRNKQRSLSSTRSQRATCCLPTVWWWQTWRSSWRTQLCGGKIRGHSDLKGQRIFLRYVSLLIWCLDFWMSRESSPSRITLFPSVMGRECVWENLWLKLSSSSSSLLWWRTSGSLLWKVKYLTLTTTQLALQSLPETFPSCLSEEIKTWILVDRRRKECL